MEANLKENTYKMIAIDLDDTLLNESLEISSKNYEALKLAHEKNIKIVLCTGRPYLSTKKYIEQLSFLDESDCFVTFNGALITSVSGKELFKEFISRDYIGYLKSLSIKFQENLQLYTKHDVVVDQYDELTKEYEELLGMKTLVVKDLCTMNETAKALFNGHNPEKLEIIKKLIMEQFPKELNCFYSKPTFLEVLNINANKGLAIEHIAELCEIEPKEIIAIGDSYNDLFMIEYAGLGVAVNNGRQALKDAANYVTASTNNQDAVAEVIYRFIERPI